MKENVNPDNDCFDQLEEYFRKKDDSFKNDNEEYFPLENSKPPHY
tara:strand:+ start:255 stop:389 length:135 start_codon:yes stop_codon:yes gene_type:complete